MTDDRLREIRERWRQGFGSVTCRELYMQVTDLLLALDVVREKAGVEYRELQDAVHGVCERHTGIDIDGAGCESGDPVDFTVTEVEIALVHIEDQRDAAVAARSDREIECGRLEAKLEAARAEVEAWKRGEPCGMECEGLDAWMKYAGKGWSLFLAANKRKRYYKNEVVIYSLAMGEMHKEMEDDVADELADAVRAIRDHLEAGGRLDATNPKDPFWRKVEAAFSAEYTYREKRGER